MAIVLKVEVRNNRNFENFLLRRLFGLKIYRQLFIFGECTCTHFQAIVVGCWSDEARLLRLNTKSNVGIVNDDTNTGIVCTVAQPINVQLKLLQVLVECLLVDG